MPNPDLSPLLIRPDWPVPPSVVAVVTTREGGCSTVPFDTFNLAVHVGDNPADVEQNRRRLQAWLGGELRPVQWLNQVHGTRVAALRDDGQTETADALVIDRPGCVGAVLTADCLPVLLAAADGSKVAVAHAGWRGLAGGILERTVATMGVPASGIVAWLGPAIGACHFEVGEDVREAFLEPFLEAFLEAQTDSRQCSAVEAAFRPAPTQGKYLADLYTLARLRLSAVGVDAVHGGGWCTVCDGSRFYSYRRDGLTGRMATVIGILPQPGQPQSITSPS